MDYPLKVMRREAERSYQRSVNARFYCMALRVASQTYLDIQNAQNVTCCFLYL